MKKKIVYLFIFIVAIILQTSLLPILAKGNLIGDNVLMLILAWSIIDGFSAFLNWSIFLGIFYDLLTYSRIGIHALIFLGTVYFVSFFSRRFSVDLKGVGLVLFLIFVVVISLFSHMVIALGTAFDMGTISGFWKSFSQPKVILVQLLYNLILFFIWFLAIKKTKEFFLIEA